MRRSIAVLAALGALAAVAGVQAQDLKGEIKLDGSSTVYLISEAMATQFKKQHEGVSISVGISGTGGGFKKFAAGETDISNASRAIKPAEQEACRKNNIEYVELQVAWDGLAVVIHPENTWARKMTMEQLKRIWHPDSAARKWSDVDPSWPGEEIKLFGAGPDSGTFDYFTEAVNGKERLCRKDVQVSEDDNNTVNGIAGNRFAMGYLGVAYYAENKGKLGVVSLSAKSDAAPVPPTKENVLKKTYPISRPLFIYVKKASLKQPQVVAFSRMYLRRSDLVAKAGYIELTPRQLSAQQETLDAAQKELK
jgi:phosphate transport system substrate-binding protein